MAGVNFGLAQAINRYSAKYRARQIRGTDNYIHYPVDISWHGSNTEVNELYDKADLIHLSEYPWALDGSSAPKIWKPRKMPTVLHQHGTPFRNNPPHFLQLARLGRMTQIVSTVDLLVDPSLTWLPNPVDVDRMQEIRQTHYRFKSTSALRIGQAPTNPAIKNTSDFIKACQYLTGRYKIEYTIITNKSWRDALFAKAKCDIWFDQLTFGYGNNAIEAMAMGIPVVGGFSDPRHRRRFLMETGRDDTPFYEANVPGIVAALERLVKEEGARSSIGQRGYDFVRAVHDERVVCQRLEKIYDKTIDEFEARKK